MGGLPAHAVVSKYLQAQDEGLTDFFGSPFFPPFNGFFFPNSFRSTDNREDKKGGLPCSHWCNAFVTTSEIKVMLYYSKHPRLLLIS